MFSVRCRTDHPLRWEISLGRIRIRFCECESRPNYSTTDTATGMNDAFKEVYPTSCKFRSRDPKINKFLSRRQTYQKRAQKHKEGESECIGQSEKLCWPKAMSFVIPNLAPIVHKVANIWRLFVWPAESNVMSITEGIFRALVCSWCL